MIDYKESLKYKELGSQEIINLLKIKNGMNMTEDAVKSKCGVLK